MLIAFAFCSSNGTYLNWERLNKNSSEIKVHHGDIISFASPPQHGSIILDTPQLIVDIIQLD